MGHFSYTAVITDLSRDTSLGEQETLYLPEVRGT
jgi:hypothetical protein